MQQAHQSSGRRGFSGRWGVRIYQIPFHSHLLKSTLIRAAASAGINMTFSWTSKAGALLQMTDEADLFSILSNKKCLRYIDAHYDSWCDFITDKGLDLDAEDIEGPVLVRGMIKTSGWGLSAWSSTSSSHALKVEGGDPGIASAGLSFKFDDAVGSTPEFRSGPKRLNQHAQYPRDQAVFLTVYKVRWKDTCIRNIISVGAGSQERTYLPLLDRNRSQRGGGASSSGSTSPPGLGGGHQGISRSGGQKVSYRY